MVLSTYSIILPVEVISTVYFNGDKVEPALLRDWFSRAVKSHFLCAGGRPARTQGPGEITIFACGWRTRTRKLDFRVRLLTSPARKNKIREKIQKKN